MYQTFTEMAGGAVHRYAGLIDALRGQSSIAIASNPSSEIVRNDAIRAARERAQAFVVASQSFLNDDTADVARSAHARALTDLKLSPRVIDDRFADFIFNSCLLTTQYIAAQVERDVTTMTQHLRTTAQRIDIYVRSGLHTASSATAAVMIEDNNSYAFRFIDTAGRRYKSSKHIRDIYRQHLLNVYNEVYMDVLAEHGVTTAFVEHPDPNNSWHGEELAIVGGIDGPQLYYDVRDEVFHPGSNAILVKEIT